MITVKITVDHPWTFNIRQSIVQIKIRYANSTAWIPKSIVQGDVLPEALGQKLIAGIGIGTKLEDKRGEPCLALFQMIENQ